MNIKQNYKKIIGISFIINIFLVSISAVLVFAQQSGTFTITSGVYPFGVQFTISREGNSYYAKNGFGQTEYQGTNATTVITSCLGSNRIIFLKYATYVLTQNYPSIELKDLVNIRLIAEEGTVFLKSESSGVVGQIMEIDNSTNVIIQGIIFDQDESNPNHLRAGSLGLQWLVRVVGGSEHVYFYNCQFLNGEQNGLVTGSGIRDLLIKDSIFDFTNEHCLYFYDSEDVTVDNCDLLNYGKDERGYLKIEQTKNVVIKNSRLEPNEDGLGNDAGSYTFVTGSLSNDTLLENNYYVNPLTSSIEGKYLTIKGGTFENISGASGYATIWTTNTANFTTIEDVKFINWRWRILDIDNSADTMIKGCYFDCGTTSFTFNFGYRTSVINNRWIPDATTGVYGFYDATGSGIIDGNHIPNSTLTFLFPSGAINGTNFFY